MSRGPLAHLDSEQEKHQGVFKNCNAQAAPGIIKSELPGWQGALVRAIKKLPKLGIGMYTRLYLKWIPNKDLLQSSGNSAQCYVAAWMGGEFGGECIHVYVWPGRFAVHLKLSQQVNGSTAT